jgi:hypothetical protein
MVITLPNSDKDGRCAVNLLGGHGTLLFRSAIRWEAFQERLAANGRKRPDPHPLAGTDFSREMLVCVFQHGDAGNTFALRGASAAGDEAVVDIVMGYIIYRQRADPMLPNEPDGQFHLLFAYGHEAEVAQVIFEEIEKRIPDPLVGSHLPDNPADRLWPQKHRSLVSPLPQVQVLGSGMPLFERSVGLDEGAGVPEDHRRSERTRSDNPPMGTASQGLRGPESPRRILPSEDNRLSFRSRADSSGRSESRRDNTAMARGREVTIIRSPFAAALRAFPRLA